VAASATNSFRRREPETVRSVFGNPLERRLAEWIEILTIQ
jgi:hypothetical protein